jgi:vacuolar-type H+-ATPase subunit H
MDDILRRMLEVERQAAQIVTNAEAEAQRLLDDGRQLAQVEGQRLRAELAEETRQLLAERIDRAEREKTEALNAAEERLQARAHRFAEDVQSRAGQVLRELAYPADEPRTPNLQPPTAKEGHSPVR